MLVYPNYLECPSLKILDGGYPLAYSCPSTPSRNAFWFKGVSKIGPSYFLKVTRWVSQHRATVDSCSWASFSQSVNVTASSQILAFHVVAQGANSVSSCFFPLWFSITYRVNPLHPGTAASLLCGLGPAGSPSPPASGCSSGSLGCSLRKDISYTFQMGTAVFHLLGLCTCFPWA